MNFQSERYHPERRIYIYIYIHIYTHTTTYAHLYMGTCTHISYIYQDPKNSWDLLHRLQFKFSSWKPRIVGGDWGRSRLVKSIDNSPRPSFLKSIGFWLLVQTGVEFAEDADTRIPRRNPMRLQICPCSRHIGTHFVHKSGINFLYLLFYTMNLIGLSPNPMSPRKGLRPFKTSPRLNQLCCRL